MIAAVAQESRSAPVLGRSNIRRQNMSRISWPVQPSCLAAPEDGRTPKHWLGILTVICIGLLSLASNAAEFGASPKRMPPPGVTVPEDVRGELQKAAAELGNEIEQLKSSLASKPQLLDLLPDVQIFHNA